MLPALARTLTFTSGWAPRSGGRGPSGPGTPSSAQAQLPLLAQAGCRPPWHGGGRRSKGSGQMCCPPVPILVCCSLCNNCWALPLQACSACGGLFLPRPRQTEHQGKRGVATVALSPICGRAQAYAQHRTAHWGTSASRSGTAQGTGGQGWARPTAPQNISYQEY